MANGDDVETWFGDEEWRPDDELIQHAYEEMQMIGAVDSAKKWTKYGNLLHEYPCDIREAYFIERCRAHGCANEGVKIAVMMDRKKAFYNALGSRKTALTRSLRLFTYFNASPMNFISS